MIHVVATIQLAAGQRDNFLEHFHRLVPLVHAEEGCIEYGPTVDLETEISAQGPTREDVVTVMEKWESLEALQVKEYHWLNMRRNWNKFKKYKNSSRNLNAN